jgi:glycosyltransferase involved in cell wall biosynthesis
MKRTNASDTDTPMVDTDTDIAVVSTTCLEVPPEGYGGLELMVYNLCTELAERGYDVTCIGPEGTDIEDVRVVKTLPPSDSQDCFNREPDAYETYADDLSAFDLVIDHSWQKLSYRRKREHPEEMADTEILGVWHGMPEFRAKPVETPNFVSVSEAAANAWERTLGFEVRHVYNGIDVDRYQLQREKADYVMTLNRIVREKGILECIDIAEHLEIDLKVVGEDKFVDDPGYVVEVMRRCNQSQYAEYVGQVDETEKRKWLRNARGLLLLPQPPYKEVFGLAAIEAMATGTPALVPENCGLAEVVETVQGTGAYADPEVLAADLERVARGDDRFPDPEQLRAGVEDHFSKAAMADVYLRRGAEALSGGWG